MTKTILITGATDGIGLATAKLFAKKKHHLLLHGRSPDKLQHVSDLLSPTTNVETFIADLSDMSATQSFADTVIESYASIDVIINNAGILSANNSSTTHKIDIRFVVNTLSPYLLTKRLLPLLPPQGRVINLSSAAQAPVDRNALSGKTKTLTDMEAYAQSKLALTMWTNSLAKSIGKDGPQIIAINPGSLLGSKMVKEGFGIDGKDISIGADILTRAALTEAFSNATGKYYDNDTNDFANPHQDALNPEKCAELILILDEIIKRCTAQ